MKYKLFGRSGLRVSELALGTMTFGTEYGLGVEKDESRKVYDAIRAAGGNFFDTANIYNAGTSEKFLGEIISGEREKVVVATKYSGAMRTRDVNATGNSRKNMMDSVHASLKRLNTEYIDLFWVHLWDPFTPVEEMLRGLDDLVRQGKVHYIGISDTPAWMVSRANTMAELRGWTSFVGLQIRYSLIDRSVEREFLPMSRALDMCITPWNAIGAGILSGKYNKDAKAGGRARTRGQVTEKALKITDEVISIANEINATPSQVALSWIREAPALIVPLVGARTAEQLKENLGCLDVKLGADQKARLDEVSAITTEFPYDMFDQRYKGIEKRILNHRPWASGYFI